MKTKISAVLISALMFLFAGGSFVSAQVSPTFHPSTAPLVSLPVIANATSTGTTLASLAKVTGVNTAVIAGTSDNKSGVVIGVVVAGAGTSGSATILQTGVASCNFDATSVVQNDFVTVSTATAGDCTDFGSTIPTDGSQVLGRVFGASGSGSLAYPVLFSVVPTASATLTGRTLTAPVITNGTTAVAATLSPTCAANSGQTIFIGATGGEVVTLPTPAAGCNFKFIITVSNTSAYNEIQTGTSQYLLGNVQHCATGIACLDFWADGSSTRALKMDGAHLGGLLGSVIRVEGTSATVWSIEGTNEGTATMTTTFTGTP